MYKNILLYSFYELAKNYGILPRNIAKIYYYHAKSSPYFLSNFTTANSEIFDRLTKDYEKPKFLIKEISMDDNSICEIKEEIIIEKSFCHLKLFKKDKKISQEKLLIVAPMAGHHATLLRETVKSLLPYYEIYITEWLNPSDIDLSHGYFDLNNYIDYVIEFMEFLAPKLNVMAVCQPTVPVLCAASYMSDLKKTHIPKSLILIGGPIDTGKNPTKVNQFAVETDISWFKENLISMVPMNKQGFMRKVYPGILQLASFLSMNLSRHADSHVKLYNNLINNETMEAERQKNFYDEYLSVMDLTEEFFLQTVEKIFKNRDLPNGKFFYRDYKIDPGKITNIGIMGIEGEKDDITGIGQTKAALDLCSNLSKNKKKYHLQENVGHYGVFSGSKFDKYIVPIIRDFININS